MTTPSISLPLLSKGVIEIHGGLLTQTEFINLQKKLAMVNLNQDSGDDAIPFSDLKRVNFGHIVQLSLHAFITRVLRLNSSPLAIGDAVSLILDSLIQLAASWRIVGSSLG